MRRLDIGIASYGKPEKLDATLTAIRATCQTDWRCFVVCNPHLDAQVTAAVLAVAVRHAREDRRIAACGMDENVGYAGAVNEIFRRAETEYIAYSDDDCIPHTLGWDEQMAATLDAYHEIGMLFPAGGRAPIPHPGYVEILWGIGCFWMATRVAATDARVFQAKHFDEDRWFSETLGHHEEVDYQSRLRLCGYTIASHPGVQVTHAASASNDPAAQERIARGVINWVNKWCRYFGGPGLTYHSPNVLRFDDWPPHALYLERYYQARGLAEEWNGAPERTVIDGQACDLIRVPRFANFYRGRVI